MKEIVVATKNEGKLKEITLLLDRIVDHIYSPTDFSDFPEINENGQTFIENAIIKASIAAKFTGLSAIGDDSGLTVDALDGAPGVYSARYAGACASDSANNNRLLKELEDFPLPLRKATFHCAIAYYMQDYSCKIFTGRIDGYILFEPRGSMGFGYDPLFYLPDYGMTMAELPLTVKNTISHRAKALKSMKEYLI